jgi:cytoskeletal protein CcmA (bactofilin family)
MALFGKSSPRDAEGDQGRAPGSQPPAAPAFRVETHPHRTEAKHAVIGPQIRIQGELAGDEDLVVEGRVEGKISVSKSLRIGQNAQVNAEVKAHTVTVSGRIVGNVTAVEKVEILPSGFVEGNIRAPKIVIAEGAQFKGSVDMTPGSKAGADAAAAAPKPNK